MIRGVHHVGLTVSDLERALAFWCGCLGLALLGRAVADDADAATLLGLDDVAIAIADLDAGDGRILELLEYRSPQGAPARLRSCDPGGGHVALLVDDIAVVLARLDGSGARVLSRAPVRLQDPGGPWDGLVCCYLADPDGHIVELVEAPGARA